MNLVRQQIFDNRMTLPNFNAFLSAIGEIHADTANQFFKATWYAYLRNKESVNLTYWADRFNNAKAFNLVLMSLAEGGWIETHSIPARNWAEASMKEEKLLNYVTAEELEEIRATHKFAKYILTYEESRLSRQTRLNGSTKDTGLIRKGFRKAGNTPFSYTMEPMVKYKKAVQLNLTKSMDKIALTCPNLRHDKASYDVISISILEHHINNSDLIFTRGNNYNDSRGRAISSALSKVANPLSCKDFRAMLVIPEGE